MPSARVLFLVAAGLVAAAPAAAAAAPARPYDLDGNGRQELVVGVPTVPASDGDEAGWVFALYGARRRLSLTNGSHTQESAGEAQAGAHFGAAVASGDFDGDGFADLAVGSPNRRGDGTRGAVTIFYGTKTGTGGAGAQDFHASSSLYMGYGSALAAADVDRDGYVDLAVGASDGDVVDREEEDFPASGRVQILHGSPGGLTTDGANELRHADHEAEFGAVLALGDVNGDGYPDLVEAAPGTPFNPDESIPEGHFNYCPGSPAGPTACQSERDEGITSLAIGDVTGDDHDDVVAGIPVEPRSQLESPGEVRLRAGSAAGPGPRVDVSQRTRGVPGSDQDGDRFGSAVAVGQVDGRGKEDLVVGARGENRLAGRVTAVRGAVRGVAATDNRTFDQSTRGVPGRNERGDQFGAALTLLDHTGDGRLELDIGAPGEDRGDGEILALLGSRNGFTAARARKFDLAALGRPREHRHRFGAVLGRTASSPGACAFQLVSGDACR